jgi:hypothetical protein
MRRKSDRWFRRLLLAYADDLRQAESMSWSMSSSGTKEHVLEYVKTYTHSYALNGAEGKSIERARSTIIAEVESAPGSDVSLTAYGSFSRNESKDVAHSFTISLSSSTPPTP